MVLVSIIVPTFGRADLLPRALLSVIGQTYTYIEIIVVDDNPPGSDHSANTWNVVNEISQNRPDIKYVKTLGPLGGGGARNVGISIATGSYIGFLDDDDEFSSTKIEKQLKVFNEPVLEKLAIVYCQMSIFQEETKKYLGVTNRLYSGREVPLEHNLYGCIAGTPTMLISLIALSKSGGFRNIKSGQDWALIYDILKLGYKIDFLEESLVNVYVKDDGRISTGSNKVKSLQGEVFQIKNEMIDFLGLTDQKDKIYADHYYQVASALKFEKRFESIKWIIKSIKKGLETKKALAYFVSFLFGPRVSRYVRNKFLSSL